jgi:hypothetical protein
MLKNALCYSCCSAVSPARIAIQAEDARRRGRPLFAGCHKGSRYAYSCAFSDRIVYRSLVTGMRDKATLNPRPSSNARFGSCVGACPQQCSPKGSTQGRGRGGRGAAQEIPGCRLLTSNPRAGNPERHTRPHDDILCSRRLARARIGRDEQPIRRHLACIEPNRRDQAMNQAESA